MIKVLSNIERDYKKLKRKKNKIQSLSLSFIVHVPITLHIVYFLLSFLELFSSKKN